MVQIAVHNNSMEIVDYISNDVPGSLHYYDDNFDIYIKGSKHSNSQLVNTEMALFKIELSFLQMTPICHLPMMMKNF